MTIEDRDQVLTEALRAGAEMIQPYLQLALDDRLDELEQLMYDASHEDLENALGALLVFLVAQPGTVAATVVRYRQAQP